MSFATVSLHYAEVEVADIPISTAVVVAVVEGVEEEGYVEMLRRRVLKLPPQLLASKWM